jgi:hypothetical protein
MKTESVQAVLLYEGESFIVQCLPYDVTGHGKTPQEARANFEQTMLAQQLIDRDLGKPLFDSCPPAPPFYWRHPNRMTLEVQMLTPDDKIEVVSRG